MNIPTQYFHFLKIYFHRATFIILFYFNLLFYFLDWAKSLFIFYFHLNLTSFKHFLVFRAIFWSRFLNFKNKTLSESILIRILATKNAVVPRSGSCTIRDGSSMRLLSTIQFLLKSLKTLSESPLKTFCNIPSLIVRDPL